MCSVKNEIIKYAREWRTLHSSHLSMQTSFELIPLHIMSISLLSTLKTLPKAQPQFHYVKALHSNFLTLNLCIVMVVDCIMCIMVWWIMRWWHVDERLWCWCWEDGRSIFVNEFIDSFIVQSIYASYTRYLEETTRKKHFRKLPFAELNKFSQFN